MLVACRRLEPFFFHNPLLNYFTYPFPSLFPVIEKDGQEDRVTWAWRSYFHCLATDIAKGLDARLREITERALTGMKKSLETTGNLELLEVPQDLVGGRLDYPKWVAKVSLFLTTF